MHLPTEKNENSTLGECATTMSYKDIKGPADFHTRSSRRFTLDTKERIVCVIVLSDEQ
jgi:hypothetical protein